MRILPLILILAACQGTPVPQPDGPEAAVLAASVNIHGTRLSGATAYPRKLLFAKLTKGSDEPIEAESVIWSNYARGSRAYLFNAAPGRYVVTCAVPLVDGKDHYVFLPENVVRGSVVEVKAGEVVYMGSVTAAEDTVWSKADDLQRHFRGRVLKQRKKPSVLAQLFPTLIDYRGKYGRLRRTEPDVEREVASIKKAIRRWGWER